MPLEPHDEEALRALFASLRSKHGSRVDDVLALWLLSFPEKPKPGTLSGRLVDEFKRKAAKATASSVSDEHLVAKYFHKKPLPPELLEEATRKVKEWTVAAKSASKATSAAAAAKMLGTKGKSQHVVSRVTEANDLFSKG